MRILIDIADSTITDLRRKRNRTEIDNAVLNGTPLPKGHGRLIDADELKPDCQEDFIYHDNDEYNEFTAVGIAQIECAPTIIEAVKESGVVFKTICNSCIICHKETIDPNPFYICDTCKENSKQIRIRKAREYDK